jgi:hypothetical protein
MCRSVPQIPVFMTRISTYPRVVPLLTVETATGVGMTAAGAAFEEFEARKAAVVGVPNRFR